MISYDTDLKIFSSSLINDDQFFAGFSTRQLKDGAKVENIFSFLRENEIDFKNLVVLDQIHSTNLEFIRPQSNEDFLKIEDTDGVITDQKNAVLAVRTADCLPIIFCDKKQGLIGVSHQGWRGSLKQMVVKMVNEMIGAGAKKENIQVAIGPGIGQCCYDVDEDRYFQFLDELEKYSDKIFKVIKGKRHLNLLLLNYLLLVDNGVKKENIDYFPFCTYCDNSRFFSFRHGKINHRVDLEEMFSFIMIS